MLTHICYTIIFFFFPPACLVFVIMFTCMGFFRFSKPLATNTNWDSGMLNSWNGSRWVEAIWSFFKLYTLCAITTIHAFTSSHTFLTFEAPYMPSSLIFVWLWASFRVFAGIAFPFSFQSSNKIDDMNR